MTAPCWAVSCWDAGDAWLVGTFTTSADATLAAKQIRASGGGVCALARRVEPWCPDHYPPPAEDSAWGKAPTGVNL